LFRKGYTLLFVPSNGQKVRRIRFRAWLVSTVAIFLVAGVGAGFYFGQDYVQLKKSLPDIARLQKETLDQQVQLLALSQKIGEFKVEMEKLYQFNKKLKIVLNLDSGRGDDEFSGQGGSEAQGHDPSAALKTERQELIQEMHRQLETLDQEASLAEQYQQELQAFLESRKSVLAATPSIWPAKGWVTSGFGYRRSPFTGRREFHKGIDIANRAGTPIIAPASGVVARTGREGGYGRIIVINHGYGLSTRYAHLHRILVKPGQLISRGDKIALLGNSGRSTGSHLHYEVRLNSVPVNPSRYILD